MKPSILVVESEQREAHALSVALRDAQWDIIAAVDAPSAIKAARESKPHVVVLAGRVLGGGGAVALRHLRSSVHTAAIPVIGVCGSGLHESLLAAGAQECFAERMALPDLKAAVAYHLAHRPVVRQAAAEVLQDSGRIDALRRTNLLDSAPEESYDRLTRLGATLLHVPLALISLVDHDRQFFKSQFGLSEPLASQRQTPLSHSFCQWVVSSGENLVVASARSDEVLRENAAVQELGVNAYAGALLTAPEGEAIGTFCAVDTNERRWSDEEISTLQDLRDIAQGYVSSRRAHNPDAVRGAITAAARLLVRPLPGLTSAGRGELVLTIDELSRALPSA